MPPAATKTVVEREEREASLKAAECKAIADDAERDLAEALPALDAAVQCLNKLKKSDIDEVRAMKKPPGGVKLTMQATCIMFEIPPILKPDPDKVGAKLKDYWEAAQKSLLTDANKFLASVCACARVRACVCVCVSACLYASAPACDASTTQSHPRACRSSSPTTRSRSPRT